ncbi:DUF3781 domain-containing protein [Polaribacter sp.]|nr:DUF3781 domain-containing protein [Polaribacter sp.]
MNEAKSKIIKNICYTDLVYQRINKKLQSNYSIKQIEAKLLAIITNTDVALIIKKGKNYYIKNPKENISITVNSNTFRVITVDKLE